MITWLKKLFAKSQYHMEIKCCCKVRIQCYGESAIAILRAYTDKADILKCVCPRCVTHIRVEVYKGGWDEYRRK